MAIQSDKAHVSRIERGIILPNRATLLRICEALELSRPETQFLLRLSGLAPLFNAPNAKDAAPVIRWLAKYSRAYPFPLFLSSVDSRTWYANALWLRTLDMTPRTFRNCFQGRGFVLNRWGEPCGEQCTAVARISRRFRDLLNLSLREITRFRTAFMEGHVSELCATRMLANADFRAFWDMAEQGLPRPSSGGAQYPTEIDCPGRDTLRFDIWYCPVQMDDRFLVAFCVPRDSHTREALVAMRHDPRPEDEDGICPVHSDFGGATPFRTKPMPRSADRRAMRTN